jgi:hypothetical protein
VNALSITTGGRLDLTNHTMIVRAGDVAGITSLIAAGRNGGDWLGTSGVASSSAAGDPSHLTSLGYAAAGNLGSTSFAGVNDLAPTDVVVKYTYLGDSDLSGAVTLDDFTLFLHGYQVPSTGSSWFSGNYDYSGLTTLDDFTLFLAGYQNQGSAL